MNRSAEADLLLTTARVDLEEAGRGRLRSGVGEPIDWSALVQAALEHGTAPLLCRHLLTTTPDLLPEAMRLAAGRFLDRHRETADVAISELFEVLEALAEAGIEAIPFKGPVLALHAYGDLGLRGYRDLDFLIREEHVQAAMRILVAMGYRSQADGLGDRQMQAYQRYNGQDILFANDRMPIEPHWSFAPRTFSADIDLPGVWARAVPLPLGGKVALVLSPEDTLVVAGLHGSKEQWPRLIWIADIAEFLKRHPDLDWEAVLLRSGDAGVLRMVLLGVALADRLLDAPVPDRVQSVIREDQVCQALADEVAMRLFDLEREHHSVFALSTFHWRVRERLSDRLRYVFSSLTTARIQHLRLINLPASLAFAYPLVKVGHDYFALPLWLGAKALFGGRPGRNLC